MHIYDDKLAKLAREGETVTQRASHVEPAADGSWVVDLRPSGGPVVGGFWLRGEALEYEKKWIEENVL